MNKTEAIQAVIAATADQPLVFTTGYACRIANDLGDRPSHFYMTGSMGLAASIATGIALGTGRATVVVDGDGALMMNPSALITAGASAALPLLHVVLDDGAYASTGGQAAPTGGIDFTALARACGYARTIRVAVPDELAGALELALRDLRAPTLIHCVLSAADRPVPPRIDGDLKLHRARFSQHLRATSPY